MRDLRGTWKEVALITAIALVLGTISNQVASAKRHLTYIGTLKSIEPAVGAAAPATTAAAPAAPASTTAAPAAPASTPAPGGVEIDTPAAVADWNAGAVFLDARPSHSFTEEGHIPKAKSFGIWEGDVDAKVIGLFSEGVRPDTRLVCYCTGGTCEDSHHLRQKLMAAGFVNVVVYKDGFPGWVKAGQPVEK